jgi:hypothetical protein
MTNFVKTRRERFVEAVGTAIITLALILGAAWVGDQILEAAYETFDDEPGRA